MTDRFDDDTFWDAPLRARTPRAGDATSEITRVNRRVSDRTRTHHVVVKDAATPPVDDFSQEMWLEPVGPDTDRRQRFGPIARIDPRLLSAGAIALAAVVAVPLLGALGDDGDNDGAFRSVAETETTTSTTAPPTTLTEIVITAAVEPVIDDVEIEPDPGGSDSSGGDSGGGDAGGSSASSTSSGDGGASQIAALRSATNCANVYEVVAGDFWLGIATKADVELSELLAANGAVDETAIFPGSEVCLPDGASVGAGGTGGGATTVSSVDPATCANTYEVVAGDFWVSIATAADVQLSALLEANGATKATAIYPGTEVCLPAGAAAPATTATTAAPTTQASTTVATTDPPTTPAPTTTDPPTTPAPTTAAPATTPATTGDTTPNTPAPSGGDVEAMIREIWPDDLEERALQIAWRESNYRPDVTSSIGCCHGVFQIHWEAHRSWLGQVGITSRDQLFDARLNIQAAYTLYQRSGGWGPWGF